MSPWFLVGGCDGVASERSVRIPLSLAQRILAALERDIWTELAAELRARMPK